MLVILGPTSTGKTDLALSVAKKFNGELVSADSRQVYRGLDIGTGKMPGKFHSLIRKNGSWPVDNININLYDIADSRRQFNVARFVKEANSIMDKIWKKGKLPVLVGGTGLYLKAVTCGLSNLEIPVNRKLRKKLEKLSLSILQQKLKELSWVKWKSLNESDRQNSRRLIRAIEIIILRTKTEGFSPTMEDSSLIVQNNKEVVPNDILKIGLTASRKILYQKIDERVVSRLNQGMVEEAVKLHKMNPLSLKRMKQLGLEYGVLADYLQGKIKNEKELIEILQNKIHQFARRQITWFKKEKEVHWFDITDNDYLIRIENLVTKWYDIK